MSGHEGGWGSVTGHVHYSQDDGVWVECDLVVVGDGREALIGNL